MTIDKHILITGANGGIGFAVAKLLAEQKAKLTLLYHENMEKIGKFDNEKIIFNKFCIGGDSGTAL